MYFKIKILENNSEYFEEKDSDWMKNPEKFIDLKEELAILNDNFSASFNLNEVGAKNINVSEMKRFVDDVDSDKINNEKNSIKRYLKYIYPDKQFLDTRSVTEKIKIRKGKDKGKEKTANSYTKKKINVFVYPVFGIIEPRPESEKLNTATGGEDMPEGEKIETQYKTPKTKSSESERVDERQKEAFDKSVKRIRKSSEQKSSS